MEIVNILYTDIVEDEDKEDGALFVAPKARGYGRLVVPRCVEARFKERVVKHASLG